MRSYFKKRWPSNKYRIGAVSVTHDLYMFLLVLKLAAILVVFRSQRDKYIPFEFILIGYYVLNQTYAVPVKNYHKINICLDKRP